MNINSIPFHSVLNSALKFYGGSYSPPVGWCGLTSASNTGN